MEKTNSIKRLWQRIKENISFLIMLLATFFALALIVALTFGSFYKSARENAVTIGNMTVAQEARRIEDALFSGMNTLLVSSYTVDSMLRDDATPQQIEEYMVQETQGIITGIDPNFSGIYGVVKDVYVDGIGWQPEPGYDPYTRPWYTAAAEKKGELAIVSPYIDAQTNSIMVSFSKILCDGKSAISFDTSLDNIYEVTETIQLDGNGYCFLVDKEGLVIAHRNNDEVGKNYLTGPEFEGSDIQALIRRIETTTDTEALQDVRLDGDRCMVFTKKVRDEWDVVLVVESNALFADIRSSLIRNIIISLAIFILVGYFCTSNYRNKKKAIRYAENIRTDDLTGMNNRGEFDRYLRTTLSSISMEKKLYLLLFDADKFKSINDRFGHQEGDRALRLIANALMTECHSTDWFCARYGGDEFVLICKCDSAETVEQIIANIQDGLDHAVLDNRLPYALSVSCGYACYDPASQSLSDLVDLADQRLYQTKATKKAAEDSVAK